MSAVAQVSQGAALGTQPAAAPRKQGLNVDSETFLTLLLAQLKNQDPMKPMDSTDFVAQLATLSSVEQSAQQTAKLEQLLTVMSLSQAQSLVGRVVTSADGTLSGRVASARVTAEGVFANLESGQQISIGQGTVVSAT